MRLLLALSLVLCSGILIFACSGGSDTGDETLCQPGEDSFCLCKDGGKGTHRCKSNGNGFGHCINDRGDDCSVILSSSSEGSGIGQGGSANHSSAVTGDPIGPATGAGGATGSKGLYERCCDDNGCHDDQCQSGWCPMGFCTQNCTSYTECITDVGDCITVNTMNVCLPYCGQKSDCVVAFGDPSTCGYSTSNDGYHFTTCADWGSSLELPPAGSSCTEDLQCNLGNEGEAFVCFSGGCSNGCYSDFDCPTGTYCLSQGQFDSCQ